MSLVLSSLLSACTIDPGPDLLPPATCNAPSAFFVTDVWPKYFAQYTCGKGDCHDATVGHGFFRLQSVAGVPAPDPASPVLSWPAPWQANLQAVLQNVSCSAPTTSLVLVVPSGRGQPHPAGTVVTDIPAADMLFQTWLGR
jgi:hypothetical protein